MNVIHTHTHTHTQETNNRLPWGGAMLLCMYVTHTHTHTDDGFTLDMQAKGKFDGGVPFFFL